MDAALELETRRRIFARVVDEPGAYLRELQRALGMAMGALEYHLGYLEKAGLVSVVQEEHKRYFPARMDAADKRHLALLRQDVPRRIVLHLLASSPASHGRLREALGVLPSTASYYLAKMTDAGIATRTKDGRQNLYALRDPERAYSLLVRYGPTFVDRLVDRFLDGFEAVPRRAPDRDTS